MIKDQEALLKEILSELLDIDPSTITDGTSTDTVESWDSLNHFSLVASVEQEFHVRFSDDEVASLLSYERILVTLSAKLARAS